MLADLERAAGATPDGCAWLDERTVADLELPLVARAIDRTVTPTGAQVLWRMLAAPALSLAILHARERELARFTQRAERARVRDALGRIADADAPYVPRLLWTETAPVNPRRATPSLVALVTAAVVAIWWLPALLLAVAIFAAHVFVDDWLGLHHADQAHALEVLGVHLAAASRLGELSDDDRAAVTPLRRRIAMLSVRDPLGILDALRAGVLVRLFAIAACMRIVERERDRLRRIVLRVGELDALAAIGQLRSERSNACVPELRSEPLNIDARRIAHPAIARAVGNDFAGASLVVTGSNAAGKSTFLRTLALQAILAQSIHTTFGAWRAGLFRVRAAMRVRDDTEAATSTYAAEVAAIGELVAAAGQAPPSLFVVDEPFRGTNPVQRIPIAIAVLDFLAADDAVLVATHDLDVATRLAPAFQRGHFADALDYKLRPGTAASTNAVELLAGAGYPAAIVERVAKDIATGYE